MRYLVPTVVLLALACGGDPSPPADVPAVDAAPVDAPPPPLGVSPAVPRLRPSFPLAVGDRWTWTVTRHVGAGMRVLFVPTEPATTDVISTWELTIDRAEPDGRFAATRTRTDAGGLPQRTDLVLWLKDGDLWMIGPDGPVPALTMTVPPDPVAPEKVACVAVFLDGVPGFCSPAPGGPLDVPPGPVYGVVSADSDNGRSLAQLLVGIGTAGLLIPGNKSASEILELNRWAPATPAPPSPVVERWRSDPRPSALPALLAGAVTREDAAAIVALAPDADRRAVTKATLAAVSVADRPALLRVALSAIADGRLETLAAHDLGGTPSPADVDALVTLLPEADLAAGRAMLAGGWPTLRAVLVADAPSRLAAVRGGPPALGVDEAVAILPWIDPPGPALDVLIERVPARDRLPLLTAACAAQSFDDERLALLTGRAPMLAAADLAAIGALLDAFTFDEGRQKALLAVIDAAAPAQRPPLLVLGVEKLSFDDAKLALLDSRPEVTRALSARDRERVLAAFPFQREAAEAKLRR